MRELAAEIVGAITTFDIKCYTLGYTDAGETWELLGHIKGKLEEFAGGSLTAEQIEDLVDSVQSLLLADPGFLRDVCLTYAKTFSIADYNGWFGKE